MPAMMQTRRHVAVRARKRPRKRPRSATPRRRAVCSRARFLLTSNLWKKKKMSEAVASDEVLSFTAFARTRGWSRSYVTKLRQTGRLVLTPDGKRVCVAASLQRIHDTRDPSKAGVAARHAAARAASDTTAPEATTTTDEAHAANDDDSDDADILITTEGYQHWRERTERARALKAERDNAIADGDLLAAEDVVAAIASAGTLLRTSLERLPDTLSPQLAAMHDEGQVRALMIEQIQHALADLSRQFASIVSAPE